MSTALKRNSVVPSPSSSSSEVMDLERMDRAVVGARFGGGGAEEDGVREREMSKKSKNCRSFCFSSESYTKKGFKKETAEQLCNIT